MLKVLGFAAASLAGLATAAVSYRAFAQHQNGKALVIHTAHGIDQGMFVPLGGVEQWVQIRGEDDRNPVVLVVHGGPGMSYVPFTPYFRAWEKHFTVVQWDRRGVGRTYRHNGTADSSAISFDRMADDGVELAEWLRDRLHRPTVVLLGHSVGSVVATLMAQRRPELFTAYVGTDQVVDMGRNESLSYEMLVQRASASGDPKLLASVEKVGPPPYTVVDRWFDKQRLISATDPVAKSFENTLFKRIMTAPGYSLKDMSALGTGLKYSAAVHLHEMMTLDIRANGTELRLPVLVIEGENDVLDPTALAVAWFDTLQAPTKKLVLIKGAGHNAMLMHGDEFLGALRAFLTETSVVPANPPTSN